MEILISMVIMCLILLGLANVFLSSKRYIMHSRSRVAGGELGGSFLAPLQANVNHSAWNTTVPGDYNNLLVQGNWTGANVTLDKVYTPHYNVSIPANLSTYQQVRKVRVNITWPED